MNETKGSLPSVNQRIKDLINDAYKGSVRKFSLAMGLSDYQKINRLFSVDKRNGKYPEPSISILTLISNTFSISLEWLQTGNEPKYRNEVDIARKPKKLIPFYDDVTSIGGNNGVSADLSSVKQSVEYIDTGDWFREATAAIRHYGESMTEYPSGCILAIKRVNDRRLIVPGRDYVIETSEYRVTKRIQRGHDETCFTAYSTNQETYADGRLIHEPFEIPWDAVLSVSLVLGYVVKKNGGSIIYKKPE